MNWYEMCAHTFVVNRYSKGEVHVLIYTCRGHLGSRTAQAFAFVARPIAVAFAPIVHTLPQSMILEDQPREVASSWQSDRAGTLSPWSQARVWALNEVWPQLHPDTTHGQNTWSVSKVFAIKAPGAGKGAGEGTGRVKSKRVPPPPLLL